uniref:Terpene synthase n=1 Tax=Laurencia pacifica TaxID=290688 RepID=A0A286R624_9FLOR|nr:putative sesquiterpene synthase [Laurencia pacifica]
MSIARNIASTHSTRGDTIQAGPTTLTFNSFLSFGEEFINEHEEVVRKETLDWLLKENAITSQRHLEKIDNHEFHRLSARVFPFGGYHGQRVANDLMIVTFLYDDMNDAVEPTDEISMKNMMKVQNQMKRVLRGATPFPDDHATVKCMHNILERCDVYNKGWLELLREEIFRYIDANQLERMNRQNKQSLMYSSFENVRYYSGGAMFMIVLSASMCCKGSKYELMLPPYTAILMRMAVNHIQWVNDVVSINKERAEATNSNMVYVFSNKGKLPLPEAVQRALDRVNEECEAFLDLEEKMYANGLIEGHEDMLNYIEALKFWMRGSLDWHFESARYRVPN